MEKHVKKFSHLIPNLKKKKFELITQILGQNKYEEIKSKLKSKKIAKVAKSRDRVQRNQGPVKASKTIDGSPKINTKDSEDREDIVTYKGAITDKYMKLGGLGFNKDESWDIAHERRRNMLNFSHRITGKDYFDKI